MIVFAISRAATLLPSPLASLKAPPPLIYSAISFSRPCKQSFHRTRTHRNSLSTSQNRIYDSVRDPASLQTLILLSSSARTPLITLWKTSWCSSCAVIAPLIQSLVSSGATPNGGGGKSVGYAEVELDAPDMVEIGQRYSVSSVPTLMAFDRQEAQLVTRVTDVEKLKDESFLKEWIDSAAARGGAGGAGGSLLGSLKGWFGSGNG